MTTIALEVEYLTPHFRELNVPNLSAVQGGKRLTIKPRRVTFHPYPDGLRVYVEGRSVTQSTGNLGQQNRSIVFGARMTGLSYDDSVSLSDAPEWLRDLVTRVTEFEKARTQAEVSA